MKTGFLTSVSAIAVGLTALVPQTANAHHKPWHFKGVWESKFLNANGDQIYKSGAKLGYCSGSNTWYFGCSSGDTLYKVEISFTALTSSDDFAVCFGYHSDIGDNATDDGGPVGDWSIVTDLQTVRHLGASATELKVVEVLDTSDESLFVPQFNIFKGVTTCEDGNSIIYRTGFQR